jgi:hypothetical protein
MGEGQRGEIDANWRASSPMVKPDGQARWSSPMVKPDGQARWSSPMVKPILVCPVEDDCRPSLEVSTQAKLVFPPHLWLPPL